MELSLEEKRILLNAARESIRSYFTGGGYQKADYELHPVFKEHAGAFVTLTKDKALRGCIGYITADEPLFLTVCDAARKAAFTDPRFDPLRGEELDKVELEISVLSPPFKMNSYDEIVLGKHGVILEDLGRRALLLPQVPIEHRMNKDEYLSALCEKAGLPSNLWQKRNLNMLLFTASVFSEEEAGG
ncbi:MAG TPA: AmmeMemoRadiSam system protein A [Ignavibacteriales bacterium]|nr:AmmeMemoRadiSam system protein A [Ignavibacteriales bacterium]